MFSLVLLTGLAVVSQGSPEKPQPAVPVVKVDFVYPSIFEQVTSASPEVGYKIPTPVSSLEGGLPHVQKASKRPITAMFESKGWFFYATSIAWDEKTGEPRLLISGYAIKRDGRQVIGWSVW
jgi:hypothetical protein